MNSRTHPYLTSILALLVLAGLLLAACAPAAAPAPAAPAAPAAATSAPAAAAQPTSAPAAASTGAKKPLVVLIPTEASTFDPAVNYDFNGAPVLGSVYEPLVAAVGEKDPKIVPALAESWEKSPDGLVYTFKLKKGPKFRDGSPVNAEAVKFSFERLLKLNMGAVANFTSIDKIEAVDELTVRFTLKEPFTQFLPALTSMWGPAIVNPAVVKAHEKDGDLGQAWLAENDAGSGPYKLAKWDRGQQIILERDPNYWGGWGDKYVDQIIVRPIGESTTMRLMLEKGDADLAYGLSVEDVDALAKTPGVKVQEYMGGGIVEMRLNTTKKPLDNPKVRQALNYSFDYDQAVQGVVSGHARPMDSIMASGMPGHYKPSFQYKKDLDKAKQLLAEAGYPNGGFTLDYVWLTGLERDRRLGEMWQADLKKLGIDLNIREMPNATWWDAQAHPETAPQTFMGGWGNDYADATQQVWAMYYSGNWPPAGSNYYFYKNEKVDSLLKQARVEQDPAKRDQLYQEATEIIYTEAPEVWIMQPNDRIALRDNVKGYEYNFSYGPWYFPFAKMYKE
jgi:peptide/nickel transport system substrate-binding protein